MIRAFLFDLDGTLVQTEKLKALSYAMAVQRLKNLTEPDERAIRAYQEIVGAPQDVASGHVTKKLNLEDDLRPLMEQYGVTQPWQVLRAMRAEIYSDMVADPEVLRNNQWPYTVEVLNAARETCMTAIVTGSSRKDVLHVLHSLGIEHMIDFIVAGDDVKQGKPNPESYLLAARKLGIPPKECLALEDSVKGVQAALAAGVNVIAVATPFTNAGLHASEIIEDVWIVHEPEQLAETIRRRIQEHDRVGHRRRRTSKKDGDKVSD